MQLLITLVVAVFFIFFTMHYDYGLAIRLSGRGNNFY